MRRRAIWEYLRGALWALPTLAVAVALIAGSVLSAINVDVHSRFSKLIFQGTADDARTLLIGIASTLVTVIALVLGLTVVALQLASTQFSPRLLRNFLRDGVNQITLSVFVATFAYSSAGLYTVGVTGGLRTSDFPRLAVTGALVLLFASLLMLVFFVHHLAHSIQIDEVMMRVERSTLHVIEHSLVVSDISEAPQPQRPPWSVSLAADRSGYVQTFNMAAMVRATTAHDLTAVVVPMVGEHVISGSPLVWIWAPTREQSATATAMTSALRESARIGFERTSEQDAAFGVRQLADIAAKALSPAINDPYTAVQALDHLSVILAALASKPLGNQVLRDREGHVREVVPGRDFGYFLDLACGQIRRYGRSEPRVVRALLRILNDVGGFCSGDRREIIAMQVRLVLADAEAATAQPADLVPIREYAQRVLGELAPSTG
jgi:uncharacterized membrane protein